MAGGEWPVVIRECKPASLARVVLLCHAQPALLSLAPGGRLLPFSFGVCRAGQGKARQGKTQQGVGSTGAHHWPKTTGCRISRGWLPAHRGLCGLWIGEAPGGVGSCRDDWKSLEELGGPLPSPRPNRIARSGSCLLLALPACLPAPPPPPRTPVLTPGHLLVKEGRGCEGVREEMSGRASADVQRTL